MDVDFAMTWVADLRNPEHKQCTGQLFDGQGYCCLGRAAVLAGASLVPLRDEIDDSVRGGRVVIGEIVGRYVIDGTQCSDGASGEEEELTPSLVRQIGMHSAHGRPLNDEKVVIEGKEYGSLAQANDAGCTFAQIADWIEKNHHRL